MYDVIIIGGGPAGLSAALLLGRSCRRVLVIDAGQPRNAAAREMHGYLGRDGTPPADLLEAGRREIARYGVELVRDVALAADCIEQCGEHPFPTGFRVASQSGRTDRCRKLLCATGMRDELPAFPGVRECYGISVHHCPYCDGWEHRGKQLAAYGQPADKAAGLAMSLRTWSPHIVVLTDGQPLTSDDRSPLLKNNIRIAEQPIRRLVAEAGQLQAIELDGPEPIPADALFFNTGQRHSSDLPLKLGCEFRDTKVAPLANTSRKQKTNISGLFLAGDADGDVQFVIVAAAEGATAAVAINRELQDEERER
jgi:thioredoxin reductase